MTKPVAWGFESVPKCLICGSTGFDTVFQRSVRSIPLQFVKCQECRLVFQNPRPTRDTLVTYFSSSTFIRDSESPAATLEDPLGYYDYHAWDASYKRTARLRLKRIARFRPTAGVLLEIGTATGSFLDEARRAGFDVSGVDVSATFADMAAKKYGVNITVDFIEDAELRPESYDVICAFGGVACWRDPIRAMKNIRTSLKGDGLFVLNHPNVDGRLAKLFGRRYPEFNHASLTVFSNRTMRRCLEEAGFRVVLSQTERQYASWGRIVTYLKSPAGLRLVRALRVEHRMIPVLAFGTTLAVCKPN